MRASEKATDSQDRIETFIARWAGSGGAERANFQSFAGELCDLIGAERPAPAGPDPAHNRYTFEHPVTFHHQDGSTSTGRIDLYRHGAFVMEAKQGSDQQLEEQLALFGGSARTRRRGGPEWPHLALLRPWRRRDSPRPHLQERRAEHLGPNLRCGRKQINDIHQAFPWLRELPRIPGALG